MNIIDIIGTFGVIIIIITYFLLQIEKISSKNLSFSVLNIIGSTLILYSLMYNWNIASVLIEFFWILISLFGVYKYFKKY
jgi:hypothetical protein